MIEDDPTVAIAALATELVMIAAYMPKATADAMIDDLCSAMKAESDRARDAVVAAARCAYESQN